MINEYRELICSIFFMGIIFLVIENASGRLEGNCGMHKVPRCRILMPLQEGTHNKSVVQEKL